MQQAEMFTTQASDQIAIHRPAQKPLGDNQSEPGLLCLIRSPKAVMYQEMAAFNGLPETKNG